MEKSTKIGILGGGVEGLALVQYLNQKGYTDLTVFDEKELDRNMLPAGIRVVTGMDAFGKTGECEILFRSPGIHPHKLAPHLSGKSSEIKQRELNEKKQLLTSTTQFFLENCPCPVIGVTGTKGKGTTSTLIYKMLLQDGRDAYLGGNIGQSPLEFLDKLTPASWVVLELSSFQLQDIVISPQIAVVVMTTSEHLDYHADRSEYWRAKSAITRFQQPGDVLILNQDYEYAKWFAKISRAKKVFLGMKNAPSGQGVRVEGEDIVRETGHGREMVCAVSKVALIGRHNLENVMAAVAAAREAGVSLSAMQKVIYSFTGLPHRLEFVREHNGIKYYNDSFSTTPETSIAAVYAFDGPVILIAGGSEKNSDFREWAAALQGCTNLKSVILMGVTAERMQKELRAAANALKNEVKLAEFPLKIWRADNLRQALEIARSQAVNRDRIVLSPACASFDMFPNYKVRGEKFRALVNEL